MADASPFIKGAGKLIDTKIVAAGGSDIGFPQGYPNAIMIEGAGSVTITKAGSDATEVYAALAVGQWHPMPPFSKITVAAATGIHVGLVA